jgi:hypothetical protein
MAAGLGFIEFTTGDVLTAADANGYLASQVVMVFDDAAARTTAIASPQEGMIAYLKDTNAVEKYDGAAWVAIASAAASGLTLITSQPLSATATLNVNDCFSTTYRNYLLIMEVTGSAAEAISCRLRVAGSDSTTNYNQQLLEAKNTSVTGSRTTSANTWSLQATRTSGRTMFTMTLNSPFEATPTSFIAPGIDPDSTISMSNLVGVNTNSTSFTGISFFQSSGTMTGNVSIYGLAK